MEIDQPKSTLMVLEALLHYVPEESDLDEDVKPRLVTETGSLIYPMVGTFLDIAFLFGILSP